MATEPLALRLRDELLAAIQAVTGADYHHDLSAQRVVVGLYTPDKPPGGLPCVSLSVRSVSTILGGGTQTGHVRTMVYLVQAWAKGAQDTAEARGDQVLRLDADLTRAINGARMDPEQELSSAATEFTIETQAADGQELGVSMRLGYLELLITITARLELGEGY